MSLGSQLIKGGVFLASVALVGFTLSHAQQAKRNYHSDVALAAQLQQQYKQELKKRPSKQRVTTVYQKAMNTTKHYLDLQNQLHDALANKDQGKSGDLTKQVTSMTTGDLAPQGSMIQPDIKDWHATINYGGQTSNGKVSMAFQWLDKDNKLMQINTFYYDVATGKLSGFTSYTTPDGVKSMQAQVKQTD